MKKKFVGTILALVVAVEMIMPAFAEDDQTMENEVNVENTDETEMIAEELVDELVENGDFVCSEEETVISDEITEKIVVAIDENIEAEEVIDEETIDDIVSNNEEAFVDGNIDEFVKKDILVDEDGAAEEMDLIEIDRPNDIQNHLDNDEGLVIKEGTGKSISQIYKIVIPERGWFVLDTYNRNHSYGVSYVHYALYRNASLSTRVQTEGYSYPPDCSGPVRFYYYLEPGTYYLNFNKEYYSSASAYAFFLSNSKIFTPSIVKVGKRSYSIDTNPIGEMCVSRIKSGIVDVSQVKKGFDYNSTVSAEDHFDITSNGEYSIRVGFNSTEWKGYYGMINLTISDINPDYTGEWVRIGDKYKYLKDDGNYVVNDWMKIAGKWYHFDKEGYRETGWILVDGKWYYLNVNGIMLSGWVSLNNKWYYLNPSGAMGISWIQINSKWYYFNGNGVMQTGWQKVGTKWYYMNANGVMQTGWINDGNKWYFLNTNGVMQIGWIKLSGKDYYLYSDGHMAANEWIGKYHVNSNGVWDKTR